MAFEQPTYEEWLTFAKSKCDVSIDTADDMYDNVIRTWVARV